MSPERERELVTQQQHGVACFLSRLHDSKKPLSVLWPVHLWCVIWPASCFWPPPNARPQIRSSFYFSWDRLGGSRLSPGVCKAQIFLWGLFPPPTPRKHNRPLTTLASSSPFVYCVCLCAISEQCRRARGSDGAEVMDNLARKRR